MSKARSYFQRRILGAPAALAPRLVSFSPFEDVFNKILATEANYVVQAWLINVQRSDLALAANAALNVSNALLCVLLGHVLQQGIVGVATATVLANYLALALGLFLILRTCRSFCWLANKQLVSFREVFHREHLMTLASLRLGISQRNTKECLDHRNVNVLLRSICTSPAETPSMSGGRLSRHVDHRHGLYLVERAPG